MPATSLKPIYLAKSMKELDAMVTTTTVYGTKSTSQLITSAKKLYQAGEKSNLERDEERAYTLFMRFIELMLLLKKRADFAKCQEGKPLMKQANAAIIKSENLKGSLMDRYKEEKNCKVENAKNNCKVDNDKTEVISVLNNHKTDVTDSGNVLKELERSKSKEPVATSISSSKLFSLLSTNDSNIVIMDTRPAEDFDESHIKHSCCINIPKEILFPGVTALTLEKNLPAESSSMWRFRGNAEFVILVDWDSKQDSKALMDAMTKWDQKCALKNPPLTLQDGYKDWMLKYPMYTTQALNFSSLDNDTKTSPVIADISGVEYPNLDENGHEKNTLNKENLNGPGPLFKKSSQPLSVMNHTVPDTVDSRKPKSAPVFDRKSKPTDLNIKPSTATARLPNKNLSANRTTFNNEDVSSSSSNHSSPSPNSETSTESQERGAHLAISLTKEESLTKDSLELAKEQLLKEQEFKKLCLRKEKEAEESRRIEIQKQEDLLTEKIKHLDKTISEKDAECAKVKEENLKMKKLLDEFNDKDAQKQKEKEINVAEQEKKDLQEQVKRLREERKIKEAKKKLEAKSDAIPRGIVSANSGLKRNISTQDQNNSSNSEYTVPLSRQSSVDSGSRGLVRSHSSPNIAQMLNQEDSSQRKMPAFDRTLKPPATPTFQSNEINRARCRNLNPVYGNCPATGLRNLGNTCFMNSVIQCLSNTISLAEYFMSGQYLRDINRDSRQRGEVAEEFGVVIQALWIGQYKSFSPKDFKNTVSKCLSVCIGNEQQDSHEFLVVLMEKLHGDLNRRAVKTVPKLDSSIDESAFWQHHKSYNFSKISEIFEGLLKSTLTCLTCRKTSDSYEVFSCLSLPILSSRCSLRDCFQHFLKSEKISGEAAWDCPRCKQKKEAEKRLRICRIPEVLCIQLKRFSYEGLWRRKLQTHVDFDLQLEVPYERNSDESYHKYNLYSIVNHYGTLEGGHYTAYCNTNSNKWYRYDDHEVSEIGISDIKTPAAYLLFYRADMRSNL